MYTEGDRETDWTEIWEREKENDTIATGTIGAPAL